MTLLLTALSYTLAGIVMLILGLYNFLYVKHCRITEKELKIKIPDFLVKILMVNAVFSLTAVVIFVTIILVII